MGGCFSSLFPRKKPKGPKNEEGRRNTRIRSPPRNKYYNRPKDNEPTKTQKQQDNEKDISDAEMAGFHQQMAGPSRTILEKNRRTSTSPLQNVHDRVRVIQETRNPVQKQYQQDSKFKPQNFHAGPTVKKNDPPRQLLSRRTNNEIPFDVKKRQQSESKTPHLRADLLLNRSYAETVKNLNTIERHSVDDIPKPIDVPLTNIENDENQFDLGNITTTNPFMAGYNIESKQELLPGTITKKPMYSFETFFDDKIKTNVSTAKPQVHKILFGQRQVSENNNYYNVIPHTHQDNVIPHQKYSRTPEEIQNSHFTRQDPTITSCQRAKLAIRTNTKYFADVAPVKPPRTNVCKPIKNNIEENNCSTNPFKQKVTDRTTLGNQINTGLPQELTVFQFTPSTHKENIIHSTQSKQIIKYNCEPLEITKHERQKFKDFTKIHDKGVSSGAKENSSQNLTNIQIKPNFQPSMQGNDVRENNKPIQGSINNSVQFPVQPLLPETRTNTYFEEPNLQSNVQSNNFSQNNEKIRRNINTNDAQVQDIIPIFTNNLNNNTVTEPNIDFQSIVPSNNSSQSIEKKQNINTFDEQVEDSILSTFTNNLSINTVIQPNIDLQPNEQSNQNNKKMQRDINATQIQGSNNTITQPNIDSKVNEQSSQNNEKMQRDLNAFDAQIQPSNNTITQPNIDLKPNEQSSQNNEKMQRDINAFDEQIQGSNLSDSTVTQTNTVSVKKQNYLQEIEEHSQENTKAKPVLDNTQVLNQTNEQSSQNNEKMQRDFNEFDEQIQGSNNILTQSNIDLKPNEQSSQNNEKMQRDINVFDEQIQESNLSDTTVTQTKTVSVKKQNYLPEIEEKSQENTKAQPVLDNTHVLNQTNEQSSRNNEKMHRDINAFDVQIQDSNNTITQPNMDLQPNEQSSQNNEKIQRDINTFDAQIQESNLSDRTVTQPKTVSVKKQNYLPEIEEKSQENTKAQPVLDNTHVLNQTNEQSSRNNEKMHTDINAFDVHIQDSNNTIRQPNMDLQPNEQSSQNNEKIQRDINTFDAQIQESNLSDRTVTQPKTVSVKKQNYLPEIEKKSQENTKAQPVLDNTHVLNQTNEQSSRNNEKMHRDINAFDVQIQDSNNTETQPNMDLQPNEQSSQNNEKIQRDINAFDVQIQDSNLSDRTVTRTKIVSVKKQNYLPGIEEKSQENTKAQPLLDNTHVLNQTNEQSSQNNKKMQRGINAFDAQIQDSNNAVTQPNIDLQPNGQTSQNNEKMLRDINAFDAQHQDSNNTVTQSNIDLKPNEQSSLNSGKMQRNINAFDEQIQDNYLNNRTVTQTKTVSVKKQNYIPEREEKSQEHAKAQPVLDKTYVFNINMQSEDHSKNNVKSQLCNTENLETQNQNNTYSTFESHSNYITTSSVLAEKPNIVSENESEIKVSVKMPTVSVNQKYTNYSLREHQQKALSNEDSVTIAIDNEKKYGLSTNLIVTQESENNAQQQIDEVGNTSDADLIQFDISEPEVSFLATEIHMSSSVEEENLIQANLTGIDCSDDHNLKVESRSSKNENGDNTKKEERVGNQENVPNIEMNDNVINKNLVFLLNESEIPKTQSSTSSIINASNVDDNYSNMHQNTTIETLLSNNECSCNNEAQPQNFQSIQDNIEETHSFAVSAEENFKLHINKKKYHHVQDTDEDHKIKRLKLDDTSKIIEVNIDIKIYEKVTKLLEEIRQKAVPFEKEIENFTELEDSNKYYYIEESLRRLIDKLDDMFDDIGENRVLRDERKKVYKFIFPLFDKLDDKVAENRKRIEKERNKQK